MKLLVFPLVLLFQTCFSAPKQKFSPGTTQLINGISYPLSAPEPSGDEVNNTFRIQAQPANLASTTFYTITDNSPGACGCGGVWQAPPSGSVLTAAANFKLFGDGYCGVGCGKCYKLTNTGSAPCQYCGPGGHKGEQVIVMITNGCPQQGNEQWCTSPNAYGYEAHFDIAVPGGNQGGPNGWGNTVVYFETIDCAAANRDPWKKNNHMQGDLLANYRQCKCAKQRPIVQPTVVD